MYKRQAADIAAGIDLQKFALGTSALANDGKKYVYCKAGATITASTAVCLPSATTFIVAATGGAYTSPATAMATNDFGWFSAAFV